MLQRNAMVKRAGQVVAIGLAALLTLSASFAGNGPNTSGERPTWAGPPAGNGPPEGVKPKGLVGFQSAVCPCTQMTEDALDVTQGLSAEWQVVNPPADTFIMITDDLVRVDNFASHYIPDLPSYDNSTAEDYFNSNPNSSDYYNLGYTVEWPFETTASDEPNLLYCAYLTDPGFQTNQYEDGPRTDVRWRVVDEIFPNSTLEEAVACGQLLYPALDL